MDMFKCVRAVQFIVQFMAKQQIDTIDFPIVINVNNQCNIH